MLRRHFLSAAALLGFLALATATTDTKSDSTSTDAAGPAKEKDKATGDPSAEAPAAVEEKHFGVGDAATSGDFVVTLVGTTEKNKVKDGFMDHKAGEGAILRLIEVKIENTGKEQAMVISNFKVLDSEGREFDTTSECTMATPKHLAFEEINPGLSKSGLLCFEIPMTATGLKLRFTPNMFSDSDAVDFGLGK